MFTGIVGCKSQKQLSIFAQDIVILYICKLTYKKRYCGRTNGKY